MVDFGVVGVGVVVVAMGVVVKVVAVVVAAGVVVVAAAVVVVVVAVVAVVVVVLTLGGVCVVESKGGRLVVAVAWLRVCGEGWGELRERQLSFDH